jgi:AraC-like DNA-binding protein
MTDLNERDRSRYFEGCLPTQTIEVEPTGGFEVEHAQGDEVNVGFHDGIMPASLGSVLNETDTDSSYREWPEPDLAQVVRCRWEQQVPSDAEGLEQRVIPDGCADVIVFAGGPAVIVGPTMEVALPRLDPGAHLRGLRLRTESVAAVLGCPGTELRDSMVPLDAVLEEPAAREMAEAIWEKRPPGSLFRVELDPRVQHAVQCLWRSSEESVALVAEEVGVTQRHLRRLLLEHTGLGPRSIQRVGRLQRFLRLAEMEWPTTRLGVLAALASYSDQAHLTREVRDLAGTTPTALLGDRLGI